MFIKTYEDGYINTAYIKRFEINLSRSGVYSIEAIDDKGTRFDIRHRRGKKEVIENELAELVNMIDEYDRPTV